MTWHQLPMLRLLLPLMAGIVAQTYFDFAPKYFLLWLPLLLIIFGLLAAAFRKGLKWRGVMAWAAFGQISMFLLGAQLAHEQDARHDAAHFSHYIDTTKETSGATILRLQIEEPPQAQGANLKMQARVLALREGEAWRDVEGILLLSLPADSAAALAYGTEVFIRAKIRPVAPPLNPYSVDMRAYYANRNVYFQAYTEDWQILAQEKGDWIWANIYSLRAYLLSVFKSHCPTANEYAVMAGLVLGVRQDMDKSVTQAYADVGAMHILSVSGLHVGLIAWLLLFVFNRIKIKHRAWQYLKTATVILLIWFFALLTGCSPPALRSAVMFSFLTFGQLQKRQGNIYNSLAASAFFLLCFNPFWLWDAGFQLSYLALLGIVYYQPRIVKLLYFENRVLRWAWDLTAVSLAASISTFPLGLYYFHQFSFSTFLSGLVALPIATLLLPLGFILLILAKVPILSTILGAAVYALVWLLNYSVFVFQALPYSVLRRVWIDLGQFWLLYAVVILATFAFYLGRLRWLIYAQIAFFIFAARYAIEKYEQQSQQWFCVYQLPKGSAVAVGRAHSAATFVDSSSQKANRLAFAQQNHLAAINAENVALADIDSVAANEATGAQDDIFHLYSSSQVLVAANFSCAQLSPQTLENTSDTPLEVDAVLLRNNPQPHVMAATLHKNYAFDWLILDGSNSAATARRWQVYADSLGLALHNTARDAAFYRQW